MHKQMGARHQHADIHAKPGRRHFQAIDHSARGVVMGRQRLGGETLAGDADHHAVGKCAADVDGDLQFTFKLHGDFQFRIRLADLPSSLARPGNRMIV